MGLLSDDEVKRIKKLARKFIPERVGYWAEKIGVTYGRIAIRLSHPDGEVVLQTGILISIVFLC